MAAATKAQLAHRVALHAQAIAASEGLHPLMESILRGAMTAQVATARAVARQCRRDCVASRECPHDDLCIVGTSTGEAP